MGRRSSKTYNLKLTHPDIAKEWHYEKNEDLKPEDVTPGSGKKVWWKCEKDHTWQAAIFSRIAGRACPFCSKKRASADYNLASERPDLAAEWHPTKNTPIQPKDVVPGSEKFYWWKCAQGHEWEKDIYSRAFKGGKCPVCLGRVATDERNLFSLFPELVESWDYQKNSGVSPKDLTPGSGKKVWWKCEKDHSWLASPAKRTSGTGCPYCAGKIATLETSIQILSPELAKEWHPAKNKEKTPSNISCGSSKMIWWKCKKGHEWKAPPYNRTKGSGCPFCTYKTSKAEILIYTELKGLFKNVSHRKKINRIEYDIFLDDYGIAIEYDGYYWHKNSAERDIAKNKNTIANGLKIIRVRQKGLRSICNNEIFHNKSQSSFDLINGLLVEIENVAIFSQEVIEKISTYKKNRKLANQRLYRKLLTLLPGPLPGESLHEKFPELISEWHTSKNSDLTPRDVSWGSELKVWWKCKNGHEWITAVARRTNGAGCHYCTGQKTTRENSLANYAPNIAKEWHDTKNSPLTPDDVSRGSGKKVWWKCNAGHEWEATVNSRVGQRTGCPICRKIVKYSNDA